MDRRISVNDFTVIIPLPSFSLGKDEKLVFLFCMYNHGAVGFVGFTGIGRKALSLFIENTCIYVQLTGYHRRERAGEKMGGSEKTEGWD